MDRDEDLRENARKKEERGSGYYHIILQAIEWKAEEFPFISKKRGSSFPINLVVDKKVWKEFSKALMFLPYKLNVKPKSRIRNFRVDATEPMNHFSHQQWKKSLKEAHVSDLTDWFEESRPWSHIFENSKKDSRLCKDMVSFSYVLNEVKKPKSNKMSLGLFINFIGKRDCFLMRDRERSWWGIFKVLRTEIEPSIIPMRHKMSNLWVGEIFVAFFFFSYWLRNRHWSFPHRSDK